ncbi:hypothetical protein E8E12_009163 [Didymella heteroderae]|uniref:Uncharacterized protein n=1 Tax=Didymella heteroderae TaxID=1769908 RepID=A0A9P4WTD4_9PLEO|nr:hypothetical protein E8E12_009163 [Didymella heteroderae]
MTTTISIAPNVTTEEVMPTPFVHFSAYEVESGNITETVQLGSVYVESYWRKNIEQEPTATGAIPDGFVNQIPQSACEVGVLQAVVTVIIFVEYYYHNRPDFAPGIVHWESSALGWEDEPVGIEGQTLTSATPLVITDWDLSGKTTEAVEPKTTRGRDPKPTTRPGAAGGLSRETQTLLSQTVGTVGTAPVVVGPSSVVIVGSQTLTPGGPAVTIGGTAVALAPSATAIVVGGTSLPLPQNVRPGQQNTIGNFGTLPVIIGPSSLVAIGTQTLRPGGPAITIGSGTVISLPPSGTALSFGGTTSILPRVPEFASQAAAPPILTIGSTTLIPNAATQFFVGPGQTLTPGGTAVIDGVKISLDSSAAFVVVGSSTHILPTPGAVSVQDKNTQPELVFGGTTFTALPSISEPGMSLGDGPAAPGHSQTQNTDDRDDSGPTFIISGQTLLPGGAPITVSGSTLSLAPSGAFLVIDGLTTTLAAFAAATAAAHITPPPLTIGNGVFRPLPESGTTYQIGTAMLTPGGSVVIAGTTISLAAGATALVINGVTTTLVAEAQAMITNPPLLTIGSKTYTAAPGTGTAFIIEGQTLTPGGTITVDGMTIILSPQATGLVYGNSGHSISTALFPATTTRGTITSATANASGGQSADRQAAPTSSRQGAAPTVRLPLGILLVAMGCVGWLLV